MKALIVDDDAVNRKLLRAILEKEGYQPVVAENGEEAVNLFAQERPDIVLMDVMMPVMNGYEAARRIKEAAGEHFVPIIFLTAVTDEAALSKCVESGGDDFLTKPYNRVILRSKISAMERIRSVHATLNAQKRELESYRSNIQHELEFAEHIFQNITSKGLVDLPYVKYWTSTMSMSMFNGDLLLVARKPAGGLHLLMCDFTGHGLPAAVGALPVSEVFVAMTDRGFGAADVLAEINRKLNAELPTGFFCAAAFVDVDATEGTISIWNGGLPEILLIDHAGIQRRVPSRNLPLGITKRLVRPVDISVAKITESMHLVMYSDGLIEAVNGSGEMFGVSRLEQAVEVAGAPAKVLDGVRQAVGAFREGSAQSDDISVVLLDCAAAQGDVQEQRVAVGRQGVLPAEWHMRFELKAGILREINPVPMILNALSNLRLADEHRRRVFTILSELYTNALDHGLLGLKSAMKHSPDGFSAYYAERESRLAQLDRGVAVLELEQVLESSGYVLKLRVTDTGGGFDPTASAQVDDAPVAVPLHPAGRGIQLVKSLCRSLTYRDGGRVAEVMYELGSRGL
jgi:CheY-like chemotaxis protein/anti-sigma regulatory factor (Ser/Thr protein kinase)